MAAIAEPRSDDIASVVQLRHLAGVARALQHAPAVGCLDLVGAVREAGDAPLPRDGVGVAGIEIGVEEERGDITPIRQVGPVDGTREPGGDEYRERVAAWKHQIVADRAREELREQLFVALVDVIRDPYAELLLEVRDR